MNANSCHKANETNRVNSYIGSEHQKGCDEEGQNPSGEFRLNNTDGPGLDFDDPGCD